MADPIVLLALALAAVCVLTLGWLIQIVYRMQQRLNAQAGQIAVLSALVDVVEAVAKKVGVRPTANLKR